MHGRRGLAGPLFAALVFAVAEAFGLVGGGVPVAHAEDVLVLAIGGDAGEPDVLRALDAIRAHARAEGFEVSDRDALLHRVPPSRLELDGAEAGVALAAELGIERFVALSVWGAGPFELALSLHVVAGGREVRRQAVSGRASDVESLATEAEALFARALDADRMAFVADPTMRSVAVEEEPTDTDAGDAPRAPGGDATWSVVAPVVLAAVGAAAVGFGVWASLDATCERRGAVTGVCLAGEDNNPGIGAVLLVTGALALTGAVVWWVTGATIDARGDQRIELGLSPTGATLRGSF